jgi:hypothetical protein
MTVARRSRMSQRQTAYSLQRDESMGDIRKCEAFQFADRLVNPAAG